MKLAEWGRAGLRQARVTKMSVALLAALVLAVTAAGTAAALTTHPSRSPLASQARLPVAYNGLDGWQHGRARLTVIYVGGTTAFLRIRHWSQWTGTSAAGRGTLWVDSCKPDCASGHFRTYPAQVTLPLGYPHVRADARQRAIDARKKALGDPMPDATTVEEGVYAD